MNKKQKLTLALVVTGGLIFAGKKIYEWGMDNFREYIKQVENRAAEKTVDSFVTAVVTCRQLTIESKNNGSATVRLVVDK